MCSDDILFVLSPLLLYKSFVRLTLEFCIQAASLCRAAGQAWVPAGVALLYPLV